MVLTKKFSEFASTGLPDVGDIEVGLKSGLNTQFTQQWVFYAPGTTAARPVSPTTGILRWNTTLTMYELWNGSAWVQIQDTTSLLALLASHTVNQGASLIGLQNQSGVTSKTVQDLANGAFIVKTNNGSMQNAQALGDLTTGILKSTTSTGTLSISAALTQIDALSPVQGNIMYYNGSAWVLLAPGTPGFILQTQGAGANPLWVFDVGTGTVTSLASAAGITLTPDPITTTGTIGLTIPVLASWGGTGLISPTAHGIMIGEGASAMTPIVLSSGQLLIGSTGVDPVAGAIGSGTGILVANGAGSISVALAPIATLTGLVNTTGGSLAPSATTLTAWIDAALGSTRGNILYRNATVWTVLAPGTAAQVLQTGGAGADPSWTNAATGTVTSVATNNGLTGGTITTTGTIGLATIATLTGLVNSTGGTAVPTATTLTAWIDAAIGSIQGDVLYRNATSWVVLAPGTSGQVLTTGGAAANPSWSTNGSGTVTSVATGAGLTGGTITTSGTIAIAAIADHTVLANISGGSLAPSSTTLTALIDNAIGSTQGNILYRNSTVWTVLAPGTSGQFLQTLGAAANVQWAPGDGAGTVTSIATNNGLTGGTITSSGTIGLATIATLTGLVNATGGTAVPSATTLTAWIDAAIGSTQGNILYRNNTAWVVLAPGTAGQQLTSGGAAANVSWAAAGGTGTVTSIATSGLATGGTITTTGTITVTAAVQSDQETGTSNAVAVTPGVQQFHPSAAKAQGSVSPGGSPVFYQSYNCNSTITRNGVGDYTISFLTAFSSVNYSVMLGTTSPSLGTSPFITYAIVNASSIRIKSSTVATSFIGVDADFSFMCMGDQ